MIDNLITNSIGKMMAPRIHAWISNVTGWMFAAVWIRDEQRHKSMWVNEKRYYSGELQSV